MELLKIKNAVLAGDLGDTPTTSHDTYYMRDEENGVLVAKKLDARSLMGEAVAVILSTPFKMSVAPGGYENRAGEWWWFSKFLHFPTWDPRVAYKVDKSNLAKMVVFDIALGMGDRHRENILLAPYSSGLFPIGIDHESLYTCQNWSNPLDGIRHELPGFDFGSDDFQQLLRVEAQVVAKFVDDFHKLNCLRTDFDKLVDSANEFLTLRCESMDMLLEQWNHDNVRGSNE